MKLVSDLWVPPKPAIIRPRANFLPGWFPGGGKPSPTLTYVGRVTSTTDGTSHTFTSANIGAADGGREVILVIASTGDVNHTITGVTIGGVTAAILVQGHTNVTFACNCAIAQLAVPSGSAATIVVTETGGIVHSCIVDVYNLNNLSVPAVFATNSNNATSNGTTLATTIDVPAAGFIIAGGAQNNTGTYTWIGLTERSDGAVGTPIATGLSSADDSFQPAATARAVSIVTSLASDRRAMAVASWR